MSATWKIVCTDGKKDAVAMGLGKTVIGRGHLLQIRELKVSRHHAEVQITEDGEFILKAMHPGLPCFYKKNGETNTSELLRGQSIALKNADIFSLHSNPDCEFKVIMESADSNGDDAKPGDSKPSSPVTDSKPKADESEEDEGPDEGPDEDEKEAESDEEQEEEADGSDWSESNKKKSKTSRTKKAQTKAKRNTSRNPRKPPAKRRKAESSEEEQSEEEEDSGSDYGGRRSRRQPERHVPRLPPRRATKPISYNEDLMLDGMSLSEEEVESDEGGLPKIGRQKKADSDSDFKVDEDSGSDWEDNKPSGSARRSAPPPKISSRKGSRKKKKGSDSDELSDEEPEYRPRPTKRRSVTSKARTKSNYGTKAVDSDSSQGEGGDESEEAADNGSSDGSE